MVCLIYGCCRCCCRRGCCLDSFALFCLHLFVVFICSFYTSVTHPSLFYFVLCLLCAVCRAEAAAHYVQADAVEKLALCYYMLEDFAGMERAMRTLPERSPVLTDIAEKFTVLGMHEQAVAAYLRAGDIKGAIDCCVTLNQVFVYIGWVYLGGN